jgi:aminopeptidase YwaD
VGEVGHGMRATDALARLSGAPGLLEDFNALTATGGRLVGSVSEAAARDWLEERLQKIPDARLRVHCFQHSGWASPCSSFELIAGGGPKRLACHPLYWAGGTPANGLEANLVDIGRGTQAEFQSLAHTIPGQIAVVRHEYPFSQHTIHRRLKYNRSRECGAAGFVIVNNNPGGLLVTGSCGRDSPDHIPAIGISMETGAILAATTAPRIRLRVATVRQALTGANLIADIPGQTPEWVVVCAHYDGHDLAHSALDNATGVAAAIAIFESFQPYISKLRRGLRLALFTAEEVGLTGSRLYLQSLDERERQGIALAINLDTIAGSPRLTCLTSGFDELEGFICKSCAATGADLRCHRPLVQNSDHFNFAQMGIPAIRLVAGFDEPGAGARFLLTEADTRERVSVDELRFNAMNAGALVWAALDWPARIAVHKTALES